MNSKLILGGTAIGIFHSFALMLGNWTVITKHDVAASHSFLKNTFGVILDDIDVRRQKLSADAKQLAHEEDVSKSLPFVAQYKSQAGGRKCPAGR